MRGIERCTELKNNYLKQINELEKKDSYCLTIMCFTHIFFIYCEAVSIFLIVISIHFWRRMFAFSWASLAQSNMFCRRAAGWKKSGHVLIYSEDWKKRRAEKTPFDIIYAHFINHIRAKNNFFNFFFLSVHSYIRK